MRPTSSLKRYCVGRVVAALFILALANPSSAQSLTKDLPPVGPLEQAREVDDQIKQLDQAHKQALKACAQKFIQNACQAEQTKQYRQRHWELTQQRQQWLSTYRNLQAEQALARTAVQSQSQISDSASQRAKARVLRQAAVQRRMAEFEQRQAKARKQPNAKRRVPIEPLSVDSSEDQTAPKPQ
jgi:hypothetical protein